jgi:hypothetical protein
MLNKILRIQKKLHSEPDKINYIRHTVKEQVEDTVKVPIMNIQVMDDDHWNRLAERCKAEGGVLYL